MAYQVPASKRSVKQNRFEFEVGGEKYDIPSLKFVPVGALESFEGEKGITGILMACDNDAARDALRTLDGDQLEGLMKAWEAESDLSLGESPASDD